MHEYKFASGTAKHGTPEVDISIDGGRCCLLWSLILLHLRLWRSTHNRGWIYGNSACELGGADMRTGNAPFFISTRNRVDKKIFARSVLPERAKPKKETVMSELISDAGRHAYQSATRPTLRVGPYATQRTVRVMAVGGNAAAAGAKIEVGVFMIKRRGNIDIKEPTRSERVLIGCRQHVSTV